MSYPLRQYSTVLAMKNEEPGATAQPAGNTLSPILLVSSGWAKFTTAYKSYD